MDVRVLDTTIRDGSYEIAHQFTEEDVALVVGTLDAAGVGLIEIGHGWGVGNEQFAKANRPKVRAVLGDAAQMRIGRASKRRAKLGVMLVAGEAFSPVEYLDDIAAAGMDFVRLAYMPSDITPGNLRYIERARALGLTVSVNCTQSYILPPREIGQLAALARRAGADWWYVVDSAGGMQPPEVAEYIRAVRDATDIAVGLHAHNNLGLAVANSLAAVDAGATLVDCTLNGLGRATGNAPTEQLILALQGRGHRVAIDVEPITRLSAMYRALFAAKGTDPMHVVSGAAMLHSRNLPAITAQAAERGLSLADFMIRVGREARQARCLDKFEFPAAVFDRAAADCRRGGTSTPHASLISTITDRLTARRDASLAQVCEDLAVRAARHHVPSVLHLVPADRFPFAGVLPWQSAALVGATMAWSGAADLAPDRRPSYLLVDRALAATPELPASRLRAFPCRWDDLWLDAIRAAVIAAGIDHVWSPAADATLRTRLEAAGITLALGRGTSPRTLAIARGADISADQLHTGDLVLLLDHGPDARAAADAIRQAGAQAIAPPIATIIASRALELATIAAQRSAPTGAWVDPSLAPGLAHAVVDVSLSAIIDPGPQPLDALARDVAAARARSLADGSGTP